jgi:hypothetical protein
MDQLLALVERASDNLIFVEDYLSRNALVDESAGTEKAKE